MARSKLNFAGFIFVYSLSKQGEWIELWTSRYNKNVLFVGAYSKQGVTYWAKVINLVHRYSTYNLQSTSSGPSHVVTK